MLSPATGLSSVREAVLNRPRALNALTAEMIESLARLYKTWDANVAVSAIVLRGAGRGFCAGGDVKGLAMSGDHDAAAAFFRKEYRHDYSVASLRAAHVAVLDGVTMGGGCGVSLHGAYRVATENTKLAMPECAIGLFPDVGGSWVLPRLSHNVGWYLGLTGVPINGAEALAVGAATHFVRSEDCARIDETIEHASSESLGDDHARRAMVGRAIDSLAVSPAEAGMEVKLDLEGIARCFGPGRSVEDTLKLLDVEDAAWAVSAAKRIRRGSPLSLRLTQAMLEAGARAALLQDCLTMEYRMVCRVVKEPDFKEGVRALLVDKDNKPTWMHASLADIPLADVERFFAPMERTESELFASVDDATPSKL